MTTWGAFYQKFGSDGKLTIDKLTAPLKLWVDAIRRYLFTFTEWVQIKSRISSQDPRVQNLFIFSVPSLSEDCPYLMFDVKWELVTDLPTVTKLYNVLYEVMPMPRTIRSIFLGSKPLGWRELYDGRFVGVKDGEDQKRYIATIPIETLVITLKHWINSIRVKNFTKDEWIRLKRDIVEAELVVAGVFRFDVVSLSKEPSVKIDLRWNDMNSHEKIYVVYDTLKSSSVPLPRGNLHKILSPPRCDACKIDIPTPHTYRGCSRCERDDSFILCDKCIRRCERCEIEVCGGCMDPATPSTGWCEKCIEDTTPRCSGCAVAMKGGVKVCSRGEGCPAPLGSWCERCIKVCDRCSEELCAECMGGARRKLKICLRCEDFEMLERRERVQREVERVRVEEVERVKVQEGERARALELERVRVEEALERERARALEIERARVEEAERVRALEIERARVAEVERLRVEGIERARVEESERAKALEMERLKTLEIERTKALEIERARVREIERERALEIERTKALEIEKARAQEEIERAKSLEIEKARAQEEFERIIALEIEKTRARVHASPPVLSPERPKEIPSLRCERCAELITATNCLCKSCGDNLCTKCMGDGECKECRDSCFCRMCLDLSGRCEECVVSHLCARCKRSVATLKRCGKCHLEMCKRCMGKTGCSGCLSKEVCKRCLKKNDGMCGSTQGCIQHTLPKNKKKVGRDDEGYVVFKPVGK
jgi:hypothetical protein